MNSNGKMRRFSRRRNEKKLSSSDVSENFQIKEEENSSFFSSVIDENPFWPQSTNNEILSSSDYFLSANDEIPSSDVESCPSPSVEFNSSKNSLNNPNQSRKDKSLGLLCQR